MELTFPEFVYLGLCLEGFFLGLYSGIFAIYLQHHGSQKSTDKAKNIIFYALWVLYALSAITSMLDMLQNFWPDTNIKSMYYIELMQSVVFACCDFIAEFIIIYRCWIVWGYSFRVVIIPSFLALAFLGIWIAAATAPLPDAPGQFYNTNWSNTMILTGLALSMTVNALVTGLIVFKIFKVFQEVKTVTDGSTLRRVIFILIESGMTLFLIQLARLVASIVAIVFTDNAFGAFFLITGIHQMLNGITSTIILVRVSIGLSFHDKSSMVEASIGSLRFVPDIPNSISGNGSVDEESRHDDFEIQSSDYSDIPTVDK